MRRNLSIVLLLFAFTILNATEPVPSKKKEIKKVNTSLPDGTPTEDIYPVWGYFIDVSPRISIFGSSHLTSDIWNSENQFGYNIGLGYFYSISSQLKAKLGLGVSSFKATFNGQGEINATDLTDIDNDTYSERLSLSNAAHSINPLYINVPLTLEYGTLNMSKIGYYIDFGIEYSYLLDENNTSAGTYSTLGNYPQWGITLENIPELGYYTAKEIEQGPGLQKNNLAIRGGAGITFPLSGKVVFKVGLVGYYGLSNLGSEPELIESSSISRQTLEFRSPYINNPVTGTKGSKSHHVGIEVGLYLSKLVK